MQDAQILSLAVASAGTGLAGMSFVRGPTRLFGAWAVPLVAQLVIWFPPALFADYTAYVLMADGLRDSGYGDLPVPEFASRALLKALTDLTRSPEVAVTAMAGIVLASSLLVLTVLCVRYAPRPSNLALALALFAPLFFVVLRGSPAYLLIAWMLLRGREDRTALALIALGVLFHLSTLLVVPALLSYKLLERVLRADPGRCVRAYAAVVVLGIAARLLSGGFLGQASAMFALLTGGTGFEILQTYLDEDAIQRGIAHDVYFVFVIAFGAFLFWTERRSQSIRRRALFVAFFFVYALLEISPVVAFRFTPFFMIPAVIELDEPSLDADGYRRVAAGVAAGLSAAAFLVMNFLSTLDRTNG